MNEYYFSSDELKALALKYFHSFSLKDLQALDQMFDPCVTLRDWEISATGKTEVLAANQNIFNSVDSITVCPQALYCEDKTVVAELLINIVDKGQETRIKVCDVIEFSVGKIIRITAYKG